jgi:protein-S-isoprenylcysteine O-methyltransferase Ste14
MLLHTLWKILYWCWVAVELYVLFGTRVRRKDRSGDGKNPDRGSLIVLWVTIFSSITVASSIGALYKPTDMHAGQWLAAAAVLLLAAGLAIRVTAIYTLGKAFTANVNVHATQTVKQDGVFRYVRHPSYTGMLLIFLSLGCALHNWLSLAIVMLPPLAALLYRTHVEEAALSDAFGRQYIDYCQRTKRFVPGVY